MTKSTKYRAPALEKGLDILELIARETAPLSFSTISKRLRRSKGEIFRIMMALEARGYISRTEGGDGFRITNRLFMLGMAQPPVRSLLDCALPEMQKVATKLWQSCHLVIPTDDEIIVIARVDSPGDIGYAVRIGHKRPIAHSASGAVFFAYQSGHGQAAWLRRLRKDRNFKETEFVRRVKQVRKDGYARSRSTWVASVLDISMPLFDDGLVIATIVVPYVNQVSGVASVEDAVVELRRAAHAISASVGDGSSSSVRPGTADIAWPRDRAGVGTNRQGTPRKSSSKKGARAIAER